MKAGGKCRYDNGNVKQWCYTLICNRETVQIIFCKTEPGKRKVSENPGLYILKQKDTCTASGVIGSHNNKEVYDNIDSVNQNDPAESTVLGFPSDIGLDPAIHMPG